MKTVERILNVWKQTHRMSTELGELFSRNPVAHKWKSTYRVTVLRELAFWRTNDLVTQISLLAGNGHILGARILLRSTIETIATLVFVNIKMKDVVSGKVDYQSFDVAMLQLMLGSKNNSTNVAAINTLTLLSKHCERRYPGIASIYADLSESAHPNNEGMVMGYSYVDEENFTTHYENRWISIYGSTIEKYTIAVLCLFEHEYNNEFVEAFENLEKWLEENDSYLEADYESN